MDKKTDLEGIRMEFIIACRQIDRLLTLQEKANDLLGYRVLSDDELRFAYANLMHAIDKTIETEANKLKIEYEPISQGLYGLDSGTVAKTL